MNHHHLVELVFFLEASRVEEHNIRSESTVAGLRCVGNLGELISLRLV